MQNYNTALQSNNIDLQSILNIINELPEAGSGGVDLPILDNEGTKSDLLSGKQLINSEGNVVIGTFSIDNELNTQDDLIAQIQNVVDNLPNGGVSEELDTCTITAYTYCGNLHYIANVFNNGKMETFFVEAAPESTTVIENVVIGSAFSIIRKQSAGDAIDMTYEFSSGLLERISMGMYVTDWIFKVTADDGQNISISSYPV